MTLRPKSLLQISGSCFALLFVVGLAGTVDAQTVRRAEIEAPKNSRDTELPVARTAAERKAVYEERLSNISSHHRPIPVEESNAPFATDIRTDELRIAKRSREPGFGTGVNIINRRSVTELAGINYESASPISEPSVAARGAEILVTGNWYAAFSTDGGQTFAYIDPYQAFGTPPVGSRFCCDQLALYDRQTDTMYWLLQGGYNEQGNSFRLLVATGETDIRTRNWRVYDLPTSLITSSGLWFDFPDIAVSNGHLFITTNVFSLPSAPGGISWKAATVFRLPKAVLAQYGTPSIETWTTSEAGSLRLTQGSSDRMYWGAHRSTSQLLVRYWADGQANVSAARTVDVERWIAPSVATLSNSNAKNGQPWLLRANNRLLAGWEAKEHIGFAWNAGEDDRFPRAQIRVAMIDPTVILNPANDLPVAAMAEPHIWSDTKAIAYPAAAANSRGDVAVSVAFAGPQHLPSYAVGVLVPSDRKELVTTDRPSTAASADDANAGPATGTDAWTWGFTVVKEGNSTPPCPPDQPQRCGVWGDYYSVRPHGSAPSTWVGVGYTLQNKGTEKLRAEAIYTWFGHKPMINKPADEPEAMPDVVASVSGSVTQTVAVTERSLKPTTPTTRKSLDVWSRR
jgi:hypothetical protein